MTKGVFVVGLLLGCLAWFGCGSAPGDDSPGVIAGSVAIAAGMDCSAAPDDCSGTVYLYVVAENPLTNPAQTPEAIAIVEPADLTGGARVAYRIEDVPPGSWYLAGFLDDDGNASRLAPMPDLNDPIPYPFPQIEITPGDTTTRDLTFAVRMP